MADPIDFFFDFASPYAYFLADPLERAAVAAGRELVWRPLMLFAVLKEIGLPPPLENEVKKRYVVADMKRSARLFGKPFTLPERFPLSSHLPARLFHEIALRDGAAAKAFGRAVFNAYFTTGADLGKAEVVADIAARSGAPLTAASDEGKALVLETIARAVDLGVWGSPFVIIDGEGFFGADRLPQIEAKLAGRL